MEINTKIELNDIITWTLTIALIAIVAYAIYQQTYCHPIYNVTEDEYSWILQQSGKNLTNYLKNLT